MPPELAFWLHRVIHNYSKTNTTSETAGPPLKAMSGGSSPPADPAHPLEAGKSLWEVGRDGEEQKGDRVEWGRARFRA